MNTKQKPSLFRIAAFWLGLLLIIFSIVDLSNGKEVLFSFFRIAVGLLLMRPLYISGRQENEKFDWVSIRKRMKDESKILFAEKQISHKKITQKGGKDSGEELREADINQFFDTLQRKNKLVSSEPSNGVTINDANYDLVFPFINSTTNSLRIITWRVDEKLMSEILWPLRDKNIDIKIITNSRVKRGYLDVFRKKWCSDLKIDVIHRKKSHAKYIIRDGKSMLLGSSNFTDASMSKNGFMLDCNIIVDDGATIQHAIDVFDSIYFNKDLTKDIKNSKFTYSRNEHDFLPFVLENYVRNESKEIVLLFSCNMVDKKIIDRIIKWNRVTPISLYVGNRWPSSQISLDNLQSMKWLYGSSINGYENVKVIAIDMDVHSKLYIFKGQNLALVSSQNLTVESWQSMMETGIFTDNSEDLRYIHDTIRSFRRSALTKIESEDYDEAEKPESAFSGSFDEKSIGMPWDLPEADDKWKILKPKNYVYYKLAKNKAEVKKGNFENFAQRTEATKTEKNQMLVELEQEYLTKETKSGLSPKLTRYRPTGKTSKKSESLYYERRLEYHRKRFNITNSADDKKAIDYLENKLREYGDDA